MRAQDILEQTLPREKKLEMLDALRDQLIGQLGEVQRVLLHLQAEAMTEERQKWRVP